MVSYLFEICTKISSYDHSSDEKSHSWCIKSRSGRIAKFFEFGGIRADIDILVPSTHEIF